MILINIDYAEQCKAYHLKLEQSIDNLLKINAEQAQEIAELKARPVVSTEPDNRDKLIDLIAEDIEWQEKYKPNSEKFKPIIEIYRTIRPKG